MHVVDERHILLRLWVEQDLGYKNWEITPASADASFRRYFRISKADDSFVVMDAPPDKETIAPFIDVTARLQAARVRVPVIHAQNLNQGFLLLDDLGNTPLLSKLTPGNADAYYGAAINELQLIQTARQDNLPRYNEALLLTEMSLFPEWLVTTHLGKTLSDEQQGMIGKTAAELAKVALEQPLSFVHRDYHSRNLMVDGCYTSPGVIDYQDAVSGPCTYDLVSLLRDCYVAWPQERVDQWREQARQRIDQQNRPDQADFKRWFDLMGIQRHLKASGIFARLNHRDGKPGYLAYIPRTTRYIADVGARYTETAALANFITELKLSG